MVPQTQAKMADLMGEPFRRYTKETQQYLEQYVKAIADGRDSAAIAVKQFLAKTIASVGSQQDPKKAKGLVKREVVRVVSPGTLTDANYLDAREPAFLMAVAPGRDGSQTAGVALRLSTVPTR